MEELGKVRKNNHPIRKLGNRIYVWFIAGKEYYYTKIVNSNLVKTFTNNWYINILRITISLK